MKTRNLSLAEEIMDSALQYAREKQLAPLAIIMLDPGGHPITFKREDGAGFFAI